MLLQSKQLVGARIMSLHTGTPVGQLGEAIIDPHKLEVVAFYCERQNRNSEELILLVQDVREATANKVLVDSVDELSTAEHLIRLQEVLKLRFGLIDKNVKTVSKKRLGKVDEYVVDTLNFEIQKLYVKQPFLKSLAMQTVVIDRTQIVEVNDRQITVDDATVTKGEPVLASPIAPALD